MTLAILSACAYVSFGRKVSDDEVRLRSDVRAYYDEVVLAFASANHEALTMLFDAAISRALIGYRRNAPDRRTSEFVELGQLYPVFFRPDLVGLSLRDTVAARQTVGDQRERIGDVATILGRGLPPSLTVLDTCGREAGGRASGCPPARVLDQAAAANAPMQTAGDVLLVNYRLQERGGRLGNIVVRRNNAVIAPSIFVSEEAPRTRVEEAVIPLGEGLNVIRITPVNATGQVEANNAEATEIRVMRVASAARSAGAQGSGGTIQGRRPTERPRVTLHVLSVGVGTFQRSELNLANPVNDASSLARLMSAWLSSGAADRVMYFPPLQFGASSEPDPCCSPIGASGC